MSLLGFWRGTVEMKKARLRALTLSSLWIEIGVSISRNEESTTEGIDTDSLP